MHVLKPRFTVVTVDTRRIQGRSRHAMPLLAAVLALLVLPAPAHAYIDPISGSIILQVLAAGILAATFTLKRFWAQVRTAARRVWGQVRR